MNDPICAVILNDGAAVRISYVTRYLYTFACEFSFTLFPFDSQACNMHFSLQESIGGSCKPVWNDSTNAIVSDSETIAMYEVEPLRYEKPVFSNNTGNSSLYVWILFNRKYYSYLLTTFLPCIVLCMLGAITMTTFRIDNFKDRINVTLALLIVVASLFSQVVTTLPSSPSPKAVEIFFFYIIVRLSYVYIMHTFVDRVLAKSTKCNNNKQISGTGAVMSKAKIMSWITPDDVSFKEPEDVKKLALMVNKLGWIFGFIIDGVFIFIIVFYVIYSLVDIKKSFSAHTASETLTQFNSGSTT